MSRRIKRCATQFELTSQNKLKNKERKKKKEKCWRHFMQKLPSCEANTYSSFILFFVYCVFLYSSRCACVCEYFRCDGTMMSFLFFFFCWCLCRPHKSPLSFFHARNAVITLFDHAVGCTAHRCTETDTAPTSAATGPAHHRRTAPGQCTTP